MPRWLPRVLARIHRLAAEGKVQFTEKAFEELRALPLGIGIEDAHHILERLTAGECAGRVVSRESDEWLYVFKPRISFHEEGRDDDQGES